MQLLSCDWWLVEERAFSDFRALCRANVSLDVEQVRASAPQPFRAKSIAVIPVTGVLAARSSLIGELLGMSSYERIGQIFDTFIRDETVSGIIFDVCSPGGMVYGCEELANKIYAARGIKPMVAVGNPLMASGAYWLGAAADRVVATPSGDTGSVGVVYEHVDMSRADEQKGTKVTLIRSSGAPFKAETNDVEPLTDERRQALQSRADAIESKFHAALAKFRGVSVEHVAEHFGKGRTVDAKSAESKGMVDRVGTLQEIVEKMAAGRIRIASERAQDDWNMKTRRETLRETAAAIRANAEAQA